MTHPLPPLVTERLRALREHPIGPDREGLRFADRRPWPFLSGHCPNVPWFSGPGSAGPTAASFAAARPPLHAAGFTYPLLTLRESASAGNIAAMAAFCARAVGNGPQSFAGSGEGGLDR